MEKTTESKYKRFTKSERKRTLKRIRELVNEGKHYDEVANIMNGEGFTSPAGGPLSRSAVNNVAYNSGLSFFKRKSGKKSAGYTTPGDDSKTLIGLVLDAKLPDSKKLGMIKALWK